MTLKEKFEEIEHLGLYKDEYSLPVWSTKVLDNQTSQFEKIADDYAIEFAEWSVARAMGFVTFKLNDNELEIFKKEKGL
jgi:hypothetical protein